MKTLALGFAVFIVISSVGCGPRKAEISFPKVYGENDVQYLIGLLLRSRQTWDHDEAVRGLIQVGAKSVPAAIALMKSQEKERWVGVGAKPDQATRMHHAMVNARIRQVLVKVGAPAVSPLRELLTSREEYLPRDAAAILGEMGAVAREACPDLALALKDPNAGMRLNAAKALWQIDPGRSGEVVPVLEQLLSDDRDLGFDRQWIQESAAETLKEIRGKSRSK